MLAPYLVCRQNLHFLTCHQLLSLVMPLGASRKHTVIWELSRDGFRTTTDLPYLLRGRVNHCDNYCLTGKIWVIFSIHYTLPAACFTCRSRSCRWSWYANMTLKGNLVIWVTILVGKRWPRCRWTSDVRSRTYGFFFSSFLSSYAH